MQLAMRAILWGGKKGSRPLKRLGPPTAATIPRASRDFGTSPLKRGVSQMARPAYSALFCGAISKDRCHFTAPRPKRANVSEVTQHGQPRY